MAGFARQSMAALVLLAFMGQGAAAEERDLLTGLVGKTKAELVRRIGNPHDTITTIDGERLIYETLDAGLVGNRGGANLRVGGADGGGLFPRTYVFRCTTEIVIRHDRVAAYDRRGNDCH